MESNDLQKTVHVDQDAPFDNIETLCYDFS